MTDEIKAKRRLTDISFEHQGAHIALTHKDQGFSANNKPVALILKGLNYEKEIIEKIQRVKVELELPEFLKRFFGMCWDEAEILARMLGYDPAQAPKNDYQVENEKDFYEVFYKDKLESFEILKALKASTDIKTEAEKLTGEQFLKVLKDQAVIEPILKRMKNVDEIYKRKYSNLNASGNEAKSPEKTIVSDNKDELVAVQKSLTEKEELLKTAQAEIQAMKDKEAARIVAEKTAKIKAEIGDAAQAEIVIKAGLSLSDADFEKYVEVLKENKKNAEKSLMFKEVGASGASEDVGTKDKAEVQKSKVQAYFEAKQKKDNK